MRTKAVNRRAEQSCATRLRLREIVFALLGIVLVRATPPAGAQSVTLEGLRRDGDGVVTVERPRANFLTVAPPGMIGSLEVDIFGRNCTIIDFSERKLYRKG